MWHIKLYEYSLNKNSEQILWVLSQQGYYMLRQLVIVRKAMVWLFQSIHKGSRYHRAKRCYSLRSEAILNRLGCGKRDKA